MPADAAAQFANPLVAPIRVQPDSGWGEGQWADVARFKPPALRRQVFHKR